MKLFKKTAIAATLVLSALAMGSAQAITLDSLPSVNGAGLNVSVKDGTATLFGQADSSSESAFAEQYVANMEGIDKVINLVTFQ